MWIGEAEKLEKKRNRKKSKMKNKAEMMKRSKKKVKEEKSVHFNQIKWFLIPISGWPENSFRFSHIFFKCQIWSSLKPYKRLVFILSLRNHFITG